MPKLNRKLTEKEILNAKPKEKPYRLYDDGGLTILVRPQGAKIWQYRYRLNGKQNIYTIGKVGEIETAEARERRDEAKKLVDKGHDPNTTKKDLQLAARWQADHSFERVAREWYSKQNWAPKHAKNILSRMEKDVFKVIGRKPINQITARDIVTIIQDIEARGALDVAKRIAQYCTQVFDYALVMNLCEHNPASGRGKLIKSRPVQHRPHLKESELPDFIKGLAKVKTNRMTLAVRLLALTFVRPGELRGARWDEIDWENKLWSIPAARMKMKRDHIVPLSEQALRLFGELKQLTGRYEYILPGRKANKPVTDVALIKVVRALTNGKGRPHGFRHTASTILNEQGYSSDHIEMQLAHVEENKVRGTYNKALYLDARRKMMQDWANYLDELGQDHDTRQRKTG